MRCLKKELKSNGKNENIYFLMSDILVAVLLLFVLSHLSEDVSWQMCL